MCTHKTCVHVYVSIDNVTGQCNAAVSCVLLCGVTAWPYIYTCGLLITLAPCLWLMKDVTTVGCAGCVNCDLVKGILCLRVLSAAATPESPTVRIADCSHTQLSIGAQG